MALRAGLGDRYSLVRELGRGGMGVVYLAFDEKHGREVAVKILSAELTSAIGVERFLSEIRTTAGLSHAHIVPLLDSGKADDRLYYIMPLIKGESLRDRLQRQSRMNVRDTLRIAREVADALGYAHRHGVIHRDVKPGNILLADDRHAALADFGVARSFTRSVGDAMTATGMAVGTRSYMSPEQACGGEVDARSDVYSLGCVIHEMLAGQPPVPFTRPASLRSMRADVPRGLDEAVRTSLALDPDERFATAEELESALERAERGPYAPARERGHGPDRAGEGGPRERVHGAEVPADGEGFSLARHQDALGKLAGIAAAAAAALVCVAAIGGVSTIVHDIKLQIPPTYRPTRTDHLVVGLNALVPSAVFALAAIPVYILLKYAKRWAGRVMGSSTAGGRRVEGSRGVGERGFPGGALRADTMADGFFVLCLLVSAAVLWQFRGFLNSFFSADSELLACAHRPLHNSYTLAMTYLILGLGLARHRLFRSLAQRGRSLGDFAAARWGSLTLLVLLAVVMTMPWRSVWNSEYERARLADQRAYILAESEREILLHLPDEGTTRRYMRADMPPLQLLGRTGHVFEEPEVFEGAGSECSHVADRTII